MEPLKDGELMLLAKDVPHIAFSQLCEALGNPYARGQKILATHLSDYDVAMQQLLMEWKMKQTDPTQSRPILARKLCDIGLGALGDKLSQGAYQPNQCNVRDEGMAPLQSSSDIYCKKISESLTVGQCREKLVNKYINSFCKIPKAPWDPSDLADFKDLHTVVTVKKDASGKDTKKKEILHGSISEIFLTEANGVLPYRILVSAPAGRGKTTAVAKMAYDWANRVHGSPHEYLPLLFVVKLRNTDKRTSIAEAIRCQLLSDVADLTEYGLHRFISENQGICHILLDGLDEYAGIAGNQGLGSNIVDVIQWKEYPDCRVLVTTRPHLENFFNQGELPRVYTKMWIEGFSHDNSREYIDKFFAATSNPSQGQALKSYLDGQPLINELVITPLFCLMICHLWNEALLGSDIRTQTELLDRVNLSLMHHANGRSKDKITVEKLAEIISKLGEVALAGLLDDTKKLIFTPHDFRKVPAILDKACELGILSKTTDTSQHLPTEASETTPTTIVFYQRLAQEHLAGKYLADQTNKHLLLLKKSKLDEVLRKIKANIGDYEHLIRFAAGRDNGLCIRIIETILDHCSFLDESDRHRILLDCLSETSDTQRSLSPFLQRCVTAQRMVLKSPTVFTVVGMQNLPEQLTSQIREVNFEYSRISADVTSGLWSCLRSFPTLRSLTLSDSTLSFSPSTPVLPSVTKLIGVRVASQSYECLLSSLTGLKEIDITIDDAESDISQITAGLRRTEGHHLNDIRLCAPSSLPSGKKKVSRETMRGLGLLIRDQTENIQLLGLSGVQCKDEDDLIDLVESCIHVRTMHYLELIDCGSKGGGRLESYINEHFSSQESFRVFLSHSDMDPELPTYPSELDVKGQYPESPSLSSATATDTQPQSHNDLEHSTDGDRIIGLDEYSVEVRIPADEADSLGDVAVEALTKTPPDLVLSENEVIISVGLKVSSSKRTFETPVKVTLPHCAFFTSPEKAELVLYNRTTDSESFVATPCTAVGIPRCVVREKDLDIYIGHFSEWWIAVIITEMFIGKYVFFTPYIPKEIHKNRKHFLHLCIKDENNRKEQGIVGHKFVYREVTFFVNWWSGDIVITYSKDNEEICKKNIPVNKFRYCTDESPSFPLNTGDVCQSLIRLNLRQRFTTDMEFYIDADDPRPSTEAGTLTLDPLEKLLILLAKDVPHDKFAELCNALGYSYATGQSILASRSSDYIVAVQHILMEWKTKQTDPTQSRSILATKLCDIGLGALGDKLSEGEDMQEATQHQ